MGTWDLSPEIKLLGREADHSLTISSEVKKMWSSFTVNYRPVLSSERALQNYKNTIV
jgi:hypothetical protein